MEQLTPVVAASKIVVSSGVIFLCLLHIFIERLVKFRHCDVREWMRWTLNGTLYKILWHIHVSTPSQLWNFPARDLNMFNKSEFGFFPSCFFFAIINTVIATPLLNDKRHTRLWYTNDYGGYTDDLLLTEFSRYTKDSVKKRKWTILHHKTRKIKNNFQD